MRLRNCLMNCSKVILAVYKVLANTVLSFLRERVKSVRSLVEHKILFVQTLFQCVKNFKVLKNIQCVDVKSTVSTDYYDASIIASFFLPQFKLKTLVERNEFSDAGFRIYPSWRARVHDPFTCYEQVTTAPALPNYFSTHYYLRLVVTSACSLFDINFFQFLLSRNIYL